MGKKVVLLLLDYEEEKKDPDIVDKVALELWSHGYLIKRCKDIMWLGIRLLSLKKKPKPNMQAVQT